jgi:hypothetical protein
MWLPRPNLPKTTFRNWLTPLAIVGLMKVENDRYVMWWAKSEREWCWWQLGRQALKGKQAWEVVLMVGRRIGIGTWERLWPHCVWYHDGGWDVHSLYSSSVCTLYMYKNVQTKKEII